jgi:hypothetical protein
MRKNSGEVLIGLLVGVVISGVALYIVSGNHAQEKANLTGREVSQGEYFSDNTGGAVMLAIVPPLLGAGAGYLVDELAGNDDDNKAPTGNNTGGDSVAIAGDGNIVSINRSEPAPVVTTGGQ